MYLPTYFINVKVNLTIIPKSTQDQSQLQRRRSYTIHTSDTRNTKHFIRTASKMATRRIISSEKTILDKDDDDLQSSSQPGGQSSTAPAVPMDVILKLLAFTLAMIVIPIGSYFVTVNTIFRGNSTYAGALAAILANVVLVGYVVVAMNEDQSDVLEAEKKQKLKARQGKAE
ncbi:hypothetical protein F5B22DRAFT_417073 [Xylaria bambusicola]|uniref:uncharacterized protein n=1 Tax=Xylaria bambusicola TaxID=326684 RepID=UPI002008B614|nr:uncharacterized protein F5B22DRAFT_417073 [Xylaria bambusicola]KAI0523783.1 hypothetical protein F5B22DRAFT_417073 [Xylaria bambusicola]